MRQVMEATEQETVVTAWCERDHEHAVLPADREVIDGSRSIRALVVDLAISNGAGDELYDACAVLGRLMGELGASPTLASFTIEDACAALGAGDAPWAAPARAAVAEGFAAALVEGVRREGMHAWDFPSCTVALGEAALAIAAGHPSDDDEVLAAWAGHVARAAALKGVRRAVIAGNERARTALLEALAFVGIETKTSPPHPFPSPG
jgi:hypothetical protein